MKLQPPEVIIMFPCSTLQLSLVQRPGSKQCNPAVRPNFPALPPRDWRGIEVSANTALYTLYTIYFATFPQLSPCSSVIPGVMGAAPCTTLAASYPTPDRSYPIHMFVQGSWVWGIFSVWGWVEKAASKIVPNSLYEL